MGITGFSALPSPMRLQSMLTSEKDLDTDNKGEKSSEVPETPQNCVKDINLVFYPPTKRKGFDKRASLSKQLTMREGINYIADIRELEVEGTHVFELKLEKLDWHDDESPLRRNNRNATNPFTLKTTKLEKEFTMTSNESPNNMEFYPLLTSKSIQPLLSPRASSQRVALTLQTNEDANLIEKEECYSPELFRTRSKQETIITNYLDTNPELPRRLTETVMSQIAFAKGDSQIQEEGDEDHDAKWTSEILVSDTENNKFKTEPSPKHQKKFRLDVEQLLKTNFREASSTQDSNISHENNRATKVNNLIRKIISSRAHSLATIYYNLFFILTTLIVMTFLVWLNFHTSTLSRTVGSMGSVIHNAYFRNYWTKIACQDTMWVLALQGEDSTAAANISYNYMIKANQNLEISVSGLSQEF